jgi:hypothetical protein
MTFAVKLKSLFLIRYFPPLKFKDTLTLTGLITIGFGWFLILLLEGLF